MSQPHAPSPLQELLSLLWSRIEMPVYLGIGLTLLVTAIGGLGELWAQDMLPWLRGQSPLDVLNVLDQLLLISMLVEILQMVKISIGTRLRLASEPFLIVGLISVVRRVLIITAEGTRMVGQAGTEQFLSLMVELAILAVLALVFVRGIHRLRQQRLDEMRRLREEARTHGSAPTWGDLLRG